MRITFAVVQFAIHPLSPQENLRKAEDYIKQASGKADVIVFPEDFLTGPLKSSLCNKYADPDFKYLKHFQNLAKTYGIDIVPGSIIESEEGGFYNTTYYIDKIGTVKGRYRKVHLWLPERKYLTPGNNFPVFETSFGKIGLLICWDLIFPEAFRALVYQGVNIVLCPSYWCYEDAGIGLQHDLDSEIKLVDALCTARAFENGIIMVYANAADMSTTPTNVDPIGHSQITVPFQDISSTSTNVGCPIGQITVPFQGTNTADIPSTSTNVGRLIGHSQITVPFQGAIHKLDHNHEAMFLHVVDTSILADAEVAYEIRKDLKEGILECQQKT